MNGRDAVVPYTRLLKFVSDVHMLRIRVSQYVEHLKSRGTCPPAEAHVPFLFEECEFSCHNMLAELHCTINRLLMAEVRQKALANIEEQKWRYQKEYLTSISWQIQKNQAVPNIIKNPGFLALEEQKRGKGEVGILKQETLLMTPTNGLLALHNFLFDMADKFYVVGVIYENRSSLVLLAKTVRQTAEEVLALYLSLEPSRVRNKQFAYDMNIFGQHIRIYTQHLFLVYLNWLLTRQSLSSPDSLDYEFMAEILSLGRIYRRAKTVSLLLSMDQLQFLSVLDQLPTLFPASASSPRKFQAQPEPTSSITVGPKEDRELATHKANDSGAFFAPLSVSAASFQPPGTKKGAVLLRSMYDFLVNSLLSRKWTSAADLAKRVLGNWRHQANFAIGVASEEEPAENFDEETLQRPMNRDEVRKLSEDILKIVRREKRLFFNQKAFQLDYALPIKGGDLQVQLAWENCSPEKVLKLLRELTGEQMRQLLAKRHEACSDEGAKLRPDEEFVKKKVLDTVTELDRRIQGSG